MCGTAISTILLSWQQLRRFDKNSQRNMKNDSTLLVIFSKLDSIKHNKYAFYCLTKSSQVVDMTKKNCIPLFGGSPYVFPSVSPFFLRFQFQGFYVWLPLALWIKSFTYTVIRYFLNAFIPSPICKFRSFPPPLLCFYCHKLSLFTLRVCWWLYS